MSKPEDFNQYVVNNGNGRYMCTVCEFTQTRPNHVRNHVESIHFPDTLVYDCPQCDQHFGTNLAFKRHVNFAHKVWNKWHWNDLFSFLGLAHVNNTEDFDQYLVKMDNGKYRCSLCDYSEKSVKTIVRYHVESKHFRNTFQYRCPLCEDKVFGTMKAYSSHKNIYHKQ